MSAEKTWKERVANFLKKFEQHPYVVIIVVISSSISILANIFMVVHAYIWVPVFGEAKIEVISYSSEGGESYKNTGNKTAFIRESWVEYQGKRRFTTQISFEVAPGSPYKIPRGRERFLMGESIPEAAVPKLKAIADPATGCFVWHYFSEDQRFTELVAEQTHPEKINATLIVRYNEKNSKGKELTSSLPVTGVIEIQKNEACIEQFRELAKQ